MSIIQKHLDSTFQVAIWKFIPSNSMLEEKNLPEIDQKALAQISHPKKQLEFKAGRLLIKYLLKNWGLSYPGIQKTDSGKPFIPDSSIEISLSHSYPFAAAIIHRNKEVGIDIESHNQKLIKIGPRFLSSKEQNEINNDLHKLTLAWCAKEALYKLHAVGNILFRENLFIEADEQNWESLHGAIVVNDLVRKFPIHQSTVENHVVCWVY